MTKEELEMVENYRLEWTPSQYEGEDTFNKMMRDLAQAKVDQSDRDILLEIKYLNDRLQCLD